MNPYLSPFLKHLKPYVPGEQPQGEDVIKLNTNENPYPPSPAVMEAIRSISDHAVRKYPDPDCRDLRAAAADLYGLAPANVFVGNGSDEVLALSFLAFFKQGRPILFSDISYSFYEVYCGLFQIAARRIPLTEDFDIDLKQYDGRCGGVIFANPNAVTGKSVSLSDLVALLRRIGDRVVIVDEAYIDFGGNSAVDLISDFPNLLVVQTASKSRSLAGLRVGMAMGSQTLISGLISVKDSFNSYPLDSVAQAAAAAAFRDRPYFEEARRRVIHTRERVAQRLRDTGFTVIPSRANFLLVKPPAGNARTLFNDLKKKNIFVRYFDKPRLRSFLRVTIGTDAQMDAFLETLKKTLDR